MAVPPGQPLPQLVGDVLPALPDGLLRVVDFGSGKSYLTFALHHFLRVDTRTGRRDRRARPQGRRRHGARRSRGSSGAEELRFEWATSPVTPTRGRRPRRQPARLRRRRTPRSRSGGALAGRRDPRGSCCQHELLGQMRERPAAASPARSVEGAVRRGRDGRRARPAAPALAGYDVQIIEFVETEHTSKNLLLRATRRPPRDNARRGGVRRPQARARNRPVPRAGARRPPRARGMSTRPFCADVSAAHDEPLGAAEPRLALASRRVRRHVAARSARRGALRRQRAPPPRWAAPLRAALAAAAREAADEDEHPAPASSSPGRASAAPGWFAPSCRTSRASSTSISPARSRATSRSVVPTTRCSSSARTGSATDAAPGSASRCAWRSTGARRPTGSGSRAMSAATASPAAWSPSRRAWHYGRVGRSDVDALLRSLP